MRISFCSVFRCSQPVWAEQWAVDVDTLLCCHCIILIEFKFQPPKFDSCYGIDKRVRCRFVYANTTLTIPIFFSLHGQNLSLAKVNIAWLKDENIYSYPKKMYKQQKYTTMIPSPLAPNHRQMCTPWWSCSRVLFTQSTIAFVVM